MKSRFWCASCKNIFETQGNKKEWHDPIYGHCMKYIAECPLCKSECNEYREPSQKKVSKSIPGPSCGRSCNNCQFTH